MTYIGEKSRRVVITVTVRRRGPTEGCAVRITCDPEADALCTEV